MFSNFYPSFALRFAAVALAWLLAAGPGAASDYKVSSGDVLEVTVFRVPDLSRQLTVDVTGHVTLPPIGAIAVDGITLDEIGKRVLAALQDEGVLTDGQVTVGLVAARPVLVGGDVANPGPLPFENGLTVRRAVAMAGGVGMFRLRDAQDVAELHSERAVLALELTQAEARAAGLAAELAGKSETSPALAGQPFLSPRLRDVILASESRRLKASLEETAAEKAHLDRRSQIVDSQIETLRKQSKLQEQIIADQVDELERQRQLVDQGLAPRTRFIEEQRALADTQERASDTASEMSRALEDREELSHEIARYDQRRMSELDAELAEAEQAAEAARARLAGVNERLAQLGDTDAAEVKVLVYRRGPEGDVRVPANLDTELQPGDMVEVSIDLSNLTDEPLTVLSSQ